ncbi:MAG: hypothetical protein ACYTFW_16910 [Planctomycetota bacterium]|jgi:hypothetical protein
MSDFICKVCGKEVTKEEEAYELLYWAIDDDSVQVSIWHKKCYGEGKE